ncbi:hypothetical protein VPH35_125887 [Triticum aestivum]
MILLDKTGSPAPSARTVGFNSAPIPAFTEKGAAYILLVERDDLMANCVVDDYFEVLCSTDISWEKNWTPPASPPGLGHDLTIMLGKQDLTDVSIDVGRESFSAHRLVLATRSPVIRAQLYGPMAESKMTSITIQDMEASTFRSLLHYMYHGSLPHAGKNDGSRHVDRPLLVAADRYGMEELKMICEDKLCSNGIIIDSVVSMLELAEDHVCPKLKARCFDFLGDGDNFKMVATSGEYLHLMQSFLTLLVEAREYITT